MATKKTQWMATPQFGGWDQKSRVQNYSMVFSRARAKRKECKSHVKGASFDNEHELIIPSYQRQKEISHKKRKSLLRYFSCCYVPEDQFQKL